MNKRLAIAGLTIALTTFTTAVQAEPINPRSRVAIRDASVAFERQSTPFALVHLAYRGYFPNLPSYMQFAQAYHSGQIEAADIVSAGIEQNRISPETADDSAYLNAVELQLHELTNNR